MRRHATLASVSGRPDYGICTEEGTRRILDEAHAFVKRAARQGADIIAFTEEYAQRCSDSRVALAEPENGGTLDAARKLARDYNIYIVWPRYEKSDTGRIYNSAILIGRKGEVVGRYHKMFPVDCEMAAGVDPGTECPVFETDFGRVAMIICFDLNYTEIRDQLRPQQPDLVIFPSAYRGGRQCQDWAFDLGCYFLSATCGEQGCIVNRAGQVLKLSGPEALIVERVNMNTRLLHQDYNERKIDDLLERYGSDMTFDNYDLERHFIMGYQREDKDVDEIIREFGMEQAPDYFARSRRERKEWLAKLPQ